jgi:hypothetical protein
VTSESKALDFLAIDAGVDFTQAVSPPAPSLTIQGATNALVGTWAQTDCDGCWQLVVAGPNAAGAFTGYATRASSSGEALPVSVYAPASDAAHGYPTELAPGDYGSALVNGVPGYHYSLFDGQFSDGRLSTWISYAELWDDWCALQTPTRVDVNGESRYVCSPDINDEQVDLGKRALCTSRDSVVFMLSRRARDGPARQCKNQHRFASLQNKKPMRIKFSCNKNGRPRTKVSPRLRILASTSITCWMRGKSD